MSGLFPKPQVVTPQAPAPVPDMNSPAVMEAQRKAAMDAQARAGRASTILTGDNGPKANQGNRDTYSSRTLGSNG